MIKDITIGQYFPGESVIHKLDPRFKLVISLVYIVMLFAGNVFVSIVTGAVFCTIAFLLSKIPFNMLVKSMKPIMPILIFTSILNLLFIDTGKTLFKFWILKITYGGIETSVLMIVRIILLIAGTSLLTYTTSPILLTDAIERLLSPLKKIKVPVHELAMMMTIALRFIPTLIEETDKIMSAQKARGADMESGSLVQKAKAMVPILIPLFISAVRRAEELATAMECRCYRGGEGRTRMRQLKAVKSDYFAMVVTFLFIGALIAVNIII